jgi:hypothetical protein
MAQVSGNLPLAVAQTELVKETMKRMGDETDVSRFIPQMPPQMPGAPGAPGLGGPGAVPGDPNAAAVPGAVPAGPETGSPPMDSGPMDPSQLMPPPPDTGMVQ